MEAIAGIVFIAGSGVTLLFMGHWLIGGILLGFAYMAFDGNTEMIDQDYPFSN